MPAVQVRPYMVSHPDGRTIPVVAKSNAEAVAHVSEWTARPMTSMEALAPPRAMEYARPEYRPLPAGSVKTWRQVLGNATSLEHAHTLYRQAASANHPDRGGSHAQMAEINAAWQAAQAEFAR